MLGVIDDRPAEASTFLEVQDQPISIPVSPEEGQGGVAGWVIEGTPADFPFWLVI